jgi:Tol biopolymer transport system component
MSTQQHMPSATPLARSHRPALKVRMRKLALVVLPLMFQACDREPAAPVGVLAVDVVIHQGTGSWDIYVYDVKSGTATQASSISGADEWNPSFSNDGKTVVHEAISPFSQDLYVTQIATGVSAPLAGGSGGNDADWSPTGRFIAFDGSWGDPNVYTVPASGGTRTLVRANAMDPEWGPDDERLVFRDNSDWSVRTINVRSGSEHVVAAFGLNPAWSTDGRRIAYSDGNNIFFIAVDPAGAAVGAPVQLTFDGADVFSQQPSWSNDGLTILFHSNRGNAVFDWNLWVVSVSGAAPTQLYGRVGEQEFDPSFYGKKFVAFAGFTPPSP